jgi:hypothetical protein
VSWQIVKGCQCQGESRPGMPFPICAVCGKAWLYEDVPSVAIKVFNVSITDMQGNVVLKSSEAELIKGPALPSPEDELELKKSIAASLNHFLQTEQGKAWILEKSRNVATRLASRADEQSFAE